MKKLITPFVLLALTLAAAPPVNITTFTVTCSPLVTTSCSQPDFEASPVDPNLSYQIDGIGPNGTLSWGPFTGSSSISDLTSGSIDAGAWTFEIHQIGKKGTENSKVLATYSATLP